MYCDNCGCELSDTAKFCPNCGKSVDRKINDSDHIEYYKKMKCPSCGASLEFKESSSGIGGFMYCPYCGEKIAADDDNLLKAQTHVQDLRHTERMEDKKNASHKSDSKYVVLLAVVILAVCLIGEMNLSSSMRAREDDTAGKVQLPA